MKKSLTTFGLIAVAAALSTGCVAEGKYRELEQAYRNTLEQVAERDARISELQQEIELLRAGPRGDKDTISALTDENEKLRTRLEQLQKELQELANRPTDFIVLDKETDQALKAFAAQHPDLVQYDAQKGMVKFRSDLTFALGSADLTANARNTLNQFAGILNNPATQQYEVRIVGHTDTVPISREATRRQHPTNWHLSAHRSISVRDALESAGVSPVRTGIAGYGMYRPVAPNARGGAEPNRRVEIYLVNMAPVDPGYLSGSGSAPAPAPPRTTPAPKPAPEKEKPAPGSAEERIPLK